MPRRQNALDHALALGADPSSSPQLARRAEELARPQTRKAIAAGVLNLIDAAEEPSSTWLAHGIEPPVRSGAVLAARDELTSLAQALSEPSGLSLRGVALAARLVWDRRSPVYNAFSTVDLADWARNAQRA